MEIKNILSEGIGILRQEDKDIDSLIAPRYDEIITLLEHYINEIELFNPAYGLVNVENTKELVLKHILDSLAPLGIIYRLMTKINTGEKIADVGSGAGLPGIPLAIILQDYNFTLIERMSRRAGFLWNVKASLGLDNITVEEGDLEDTTPGVFSLVTFRALKPLEPKLLTSLFNSCIQGGIVAAYKGRYEKIIQEISPLEKYCGKWEILPCPVPFLDEKRHLLVINSPA
jgi:16S rRNA (guanine527-N7)-methyltransferase